MDRDEEIKNEFIEMAEEERNSLLRDIHRLITAILPIARQELENATNTFIDMARQMDIPFNADRAMEGVIDEYTKRLIDLNTELENLEISEAALLKGTVIDKAQEIVPLIEPSITKAKTNLFNSNKNNFLNASKQKEDVESKIANKKIQRMYLQGKLDSTWKRSEKTKLAEEINSLDIELNSLENQLSKLVFKEEVSIQKNNEKMPAMPHNTKIQAGQEQDGQEPNDDETR